MAAKRKNPKHRDDRPKVHEPETVITINRSSIEDPDINPSPEQKSPVSDLGGQKEKLPDWMINAIENPDEELIVTDNPDLIGTKVEEENSVNIPLSPEKVDDLNPVQASTNDLEASRLEKKILFEKGQFQKEAISFERQRYADMRRGRAIPVPEVPSHGKSYPKDTVISYLPYNVQDLEDINNPELPDYEKYLITLEGIKTTNITPLDLTYPDYLFICDTRHLQAMGEDITFRHPYVCSTCKQAGVHKFHLNSVEFDELKIDLPLRVRFHTFPKEEFSFIPHTIGDIITLMKNDKYWRKLGEVYLQTENGNRVVDLASINACRCISHPWDEAYIKFLEASENPKDRRIFYEIDKALYHGTKPIKFRCKIPEDEKTRKVMAMEAAGLINGVAEGDISVDTPNITEDLPPWARVHFPNSGSGDKSSTAKKVCNAINQIDVSDGDIILPFCDHRVDLEYGILNN